MAEAEAQSTEAQNKALVERSFNAWRDGTGSPFDLLDEHAVWTIVGHSVVAKRYENREAFMRELIYMIKDGTYHLQQAVSWEQTLVPPACKFESA